MKPDADVLHYENERIALADEIRTLRRTRRITGVVLARRVGISQSKLSKIETGALIPSTDDLESILNHLKAHRSVAARLISSARALRTEFRSWRFGHRHGLAAKQMHIGQIEKKSKLIRVFQPTVIPGLLQIPAYAKSVLAHANITRQKDVDAAVRARMSRQQILYESGHQLEFVICEAAALSRFCDRRVVVEQLNRIRLLFSLDHIKIGFISNNRILPRIPINGFVVLDSDRVVLETLTGEVESTDEHSVKTYSETFEAFTSVAQFGTNADPILDEWIAFLSNCSSTPLRRRKPTGSGEGQGEIR